MKDEKKEIQKEAQKSLPKRVQKSFGLTNLSLDNSTSVFILLFILVLMGVMAYVSLPKELFPEIKMPTVYVSTPYPGNSPLDIENLVTRPIEKEISTIKGVKTLKSTNIQDYSAIIVEFNTDENIDDALQDVKDAVDRSKKDLPNDLPTDPSVKEIDFSEFPILNINLSGDFSLENLKDFAEKLEDDIESLSEINKVELKGLLEREIKINVDLLKMETNEISFSDIESAIANENISMAGGEVLMGNTKRSIRLQGEFSDPMEMGDVIVKHEKGNIVALKEIADIINGYKDSESFARMNGFPVVSLDVIKKSGENLLDATDKIGLILEKAKATYLPANLDIKITNDQSQQTRDQLKNLENSIIAGVILVVLVLLFFLGIRNALFVGLAIPLSMFMSFLILSAMGVSINMVVLFALILALGMLVDNAIVVIENIYRLFDEEGYSPYEAAKQGVGEVAVPIIASTATTLAAFFPLLFWNDLMGEFMKFIPMTLIIVLSSSLFVALVINPVIAATLMKKQDDSKKVNFGKAYTIISVLAILSVLFYVWGVFAMGTILAIAAILGILDIHLIQPFAIFFRNRILASIERAYLRILRFSIESWKPIMLLAGTFLLLVFSIKYMGYKSPKVEFFPVNQPKYINIFIETPIGSDINFTDSITQMFEKDLSGILEPHKDVVESVISNVGAGTSDPGEGPSMGNTPHKARITVSFIEYEFRKGTNTSEVMRSISDKLTNLPGVKISVEKNNEGPPTGKPINLEITGENFEELLAISEEVNLRIDRANIPGIEGIKMDLELGKPELILTIDRVKARRLGISTAQIGGTIRTALFGKEISKFKDGEEEYPVQLRLKRDSRNNVSDLMNQKITFRDQSSGKIVQVPISSIASYSYSSSYGSVKRKDMDRAVTLFSNVIEGYNATEINDALKEVLSDYPIPMGYEYKFTGEQEEQAKTMSFLIKALMIAILIIALILVSQFNSIVKPFIIILSVLFSTIGVFLGISFFEMDFVVIMTGIGIVSLAGIVVNNAIVLIDYIELIKRMKREQLGLGPTDMLPKKEAYEAIVEGGKTRLRPVLLTAITTILGLLPLATGMNIDFIGFLSNLDANIYFGGDNATMWGPMAWTVIFGLTFATFLTLVIVPVMYVITERFRLWRSGLGKK